MCNNSMAFITRGRFITILKYHGKPRDYVIVSWANTITAAYTQGAMGRLDVPDDIESWYIDLLNNRVKGVSF